MIILTLVLLFASGQTVRSAPKAQGTFQPTRPFQTDDILVSISNGDILRFDTNGNFLQSLDTTFPIQPGGLAISPVEHLLYVTSQSGSPLRLFDLNGLPLGSLDPDTFGPISIVFDNAGYLYLGLRSFGGGAMQKIYKGDTIITEYDLPEENGGSSDGTGVWLDLSVDQQTMFYTSGGREIRLYNVSGNGSPLGIFATLPADFDDVGPQAAAIGLRLLYPGDGSGGLIVADYVNVKRLDGKGNVVQSYDYVNGSINENLWFTVSLDPDGKSFWATSGTRVYQFDIETGDLLNSFDAGANTSFSQTNSIWGLTIVGEPAAAQPTPTPTNTPTSTATFTPSPTGSFTPPPTDTPTETPTEFPTDTPTEEIVVSPPTEPSTPSIPLWPIIVIVIVIGAGGLGGTVLLVRSLRPKPRAPERAVYRQTRVRMKIQYDPGDQTIEAAPGAKLPQLRLKYGEDAADYFVEGDNPGKDN